MPVSITMPALSPTMEEGNLARWLVKEGDSVSSGDLLAEIETDKATMELESIDDGIVGKLLVPEGAEGVKVNAVIAVLLGDGESADDIDVSAAPPPAAPAPPADAPAQEEAPAVETAPAPALAPAPIPKADGTRIFASPLARRIASDKGIDLASIQGSGPRGRIVKSDVEAAPAGQAAAAAPIAAPQGASEYEEIRLTTMRKTIAKRMTEAKQTIPHFYLSADIPMDKLLAMRAELNGRTDEYKISVNDFIIRAAALALKKYPAANTQFAGDKLLQYKHADIAVAVAIEGGLITPIIRAADTKGLAEISNEMRELAGRAREGKLMPEEYQGGTLSVSNLGMFDITEFSAVINPPQASILAVGTAEKRAVVKNDALAIATMMTVNMACDHRVMDGAMGAEFLQIFKGYLEDPLVMLL